MSIENLQNVYNGGDVPFPLVSNNGFIHISKMIQKYLNSNTPDIDINALNDYLCFFDLSNFGNKEVLVRYDGSLSRLFDNVGGVINDLKEITPRNPNIVLLSAACAAIVATTMTIEANKLLVDNHVAINMYALVHSVLEDDDFGESDDPIFAELFVAVADSLSPNEKNASYVDFVRKILDGWEYVTEEEDDDDIHLTDEDRARFEAEWQSGSPEMRAMAKHIRNVSRQEEK